MTVRLATLSSGSNAAELHERDFRGRYDGSAAESDGGGRRRTLKFGKSKAGRDRRKRDGGSGGEGLDDGSGSGSGRVGRRVCVRRRGC